MKLANYLRLAPSGVFHFRHRVPAKLMEKFGVKEFSQSLRTRDPMTAQLRALRMAQAYAQAITQTRGLDGVAKDGGGLVALKMDVAPSLEEVLPAAKAGETYRVIQHPDGRLEIEANGREDHEQAKDMVSQIGLLSKEAFVIQQSQSIPAIHESKIPDLPIGKVVRQWLADIKSSTKTKTFSIKTTAVEGFAAHFGEKKPLAEVTRIDIGQWVLALRASGLQTPTIANKCGYLRGFLDWAKGKGYYPAFARDDNPAQGQVVFRTREKRARRAFGFKAFTDDQVKTLFSVDALAGLSDTATLGAWIGLYTGARVAEVGQLALDDFLEIDGIPCLRVTDEGEGQSVKSDSSIRTIPIHPKLIELGLLDLVKKLQLAGEKRLFPKVKMNGVNGAGNWLSKAFTRHIEAHLTKPEKGKFGFHSLRKTVVQGLQTAGVPAELRAAYVGHELDDEHHAAYSRAPTMRELLDAVKKLDWRSI